MTPDIPTIARKLTAAQRDALLGKFSWAGPMEQEEGERELYRMGLWGPHGGNSGTAIALRAYLESQAS